MTNAIAVRRDLEVFVVPETVKGTLVAPSAGDFIIPAGMPAINQTPAFTPSEEIANTRDVLDMFQDRNPPADWSIQIYCRPSGAAGTAPMEDALLEALFGTKTVVGSTSVTYSQAILKPSVSIWIRFNHTMRFVAGATVSKMAMNPATKGGFMIDLSGQGMQSGVVGTQDLAAGITISDTTFEVDDASLYSVGGLVEFYNVSAGTVDDNTTGYVISAVNTTTNIITTSTIGSGFSIDDICRPFLPTGTTVGDPLENRQVVASVNSLTTNVKKFDVSYDDPCIYQEDEITASGYPEDYVEDVRKISVGLTILFRQNDAKYFVDNNAGTEVPLSLVVGTVAGSILTVSIPKAKISVPVVTDSAPTVSLDMTAEALGTSGEDSLTMAFT